MLSNLTATILTLLAVSTEAVNLNASAQKPWYGTRSQLKAQYKTYCESERIASYDELGGIHTWVAAMAADYCANEYVDRLTDEYIAQGMASEG